MLKITGITSDPLQTFNIAEPTTGEKIYFTLRYKPRTQCWYMDVRFKNFTENGSKIIKGANIYNRHKKRLPFGISVSVTDNYEPFLINDFFTGRVEMFLLDSTEIDYVDTLINRGTILS